jgi:nitrous oxidase accessory protein NosD
LLLAFAALAARTPAIDGQMPLPARSLWTYEVPESRSATGGVVSATLDLRVAPTGELTGTVKGARGRADAPGNQPEPTRESEPWILTLETD